VTITWSIGYGRLSPGEDDASALGAGSPGSFQPDAGAAADDADGLAEQFRSALSGNSSGWCWS
jgi:hypothetical protein